MLKQFIWENNWKKKCQDLKKVVYGLCSYLADWKYWKDFFYLEIYIKKGPFSFFITVISPFIDGFASGKICQKYK